MNICMVYLDIRVQAFHAYNFFEDSNVIFSQGITRKMDHTEGAVQMIPILQVYSLLFLYPHHYFSILALKTSIIPFII